MPWSSLIKDVPVNNPLITDPVNNHYLWHHFIVNSLREFSLPLWNGANFSGIPFATGYTPHGNPIAFLAYMIFPMTTAHDFVLWIHLLLSGIFMYLYLREIHLHQIPSLIGAVSWMFKGYVMVFFEIESTMITAAAFPATFFFAERWLKTRARLFLIGLTCAVAVSISSGYTHLIIFQLLFTGVYLLYRFITVHRNRAAPFRKKDLFNFSLMMLLGFFLSANFITSHLLFLDDPQRANIPYNRLSKETGQVPAKYLATFFFPDFYGSPAGKICFTPRDNNLQPYNNYSELCIYSGVISLFLVMASIPFIFKRRYIYFYTVCAAATLTMAMGSIIYYPFAKYVIGLSFSTPTRVLYIFGFCISVLTGFGAEFILSKEIKIKSFITVSWIALLAAAAGLVFWVQTESGVSWASGSQNLSTAHYTLFSNHYGWHSSIIFYPFVMGCISVATLFMALRQKKQIGRQLFLGLAVFLLAVDLIQFGQRYNTSVPKALEYPETESIRFLKTDPTLFRIISFGSFFHNGFAPFGIEDIGGYNSFYPKRYGEYLHLAQFGLNQPLPDRFSRWISFRNFGSPLFDLLNVKYLLLPPGRVINHPKLKQVYNGEIVIYKNQAAFPRIFFVNDFVRPRSRYDAYRELASFSAEDLKEKLILESDPPANFLIQANGGHRQRDGSNDIRIIAYRSNRIELELSTHRPSYLVIADNYYPGWTAWIDGDKKEILRANYIMRALPIGSGSHHVVMEFRPIGLITGMLLTVLGWGMLLMWMAIEIYRFRSKLRHRKDSPSLNIGATESNAQ